MFRRVADRSFSLQIPISWNWLNLLAILLGRHETSPIDLTECQFAQVNVPECSYLFVLSAQTLVHFRPIFIPWSCPSRLILPTCSALDLSKETHIQRSVILECTWLVTLAANTRATPWTKTMCDSCRSKCVSRHVVASAVPSDLTFERVHHQLPVDVAD